MATLTKFEDLQIWQDSRSLVKEVYRLTASQKEFDFNAQIRRASVSVMNNIAEGFGRNGNKEFIRFLHIAKACCI